MMMMMIENTDNSDWWRDGDDNDGDDNDDDNDDDDNDDDC